MRSLTIPSVDLTTLQSVPARIAHLIHSGAQAPIDQLNWPETFPKTMPVKVHIAHNGDTLFLCYCVEGEPLRATHTRDFDPVWQDSCVEFFMKREQEPVYRNFEWNVLGVLLAARRESRDSFQRLTREVKKVLRHSSIQPRYDGDRQLSDWQLYLEIPKEIMGYLPGETLTGQRINANFYKCGDETEEPHYLSWNPVDLPVPDFHTPQFFGLLELE